MRARTVLKLGLSEVPEQARRDRENFLRRLSRRRRTPEQIKRDAEAVARWHREHPEEVARWKRQWREQHGAAYMRRYDELTPGRREYKAKWARDRRAAARAAGSA